MMKSVNELREIYMEIIKDLEIEFENSDLTEYRYRDELRESILYHEKLLNEIKLNNDEN